MDLSKVGLKIKDFSSPFPVIQAGMGVRVGIGRLAGTVINEGGMGVIASVGLGDVRRSLGANYKDESSSQLREEIRTARKITGGRGPLGVNVMVALTNYENLVRTAVDEGVEFVISGAGLPLRLPAYVDEKTAIIPVISSKRALELVMKTWKKRYNRVPDAIIIEGPLCGGHMGFSEEQLKNPETCAIDILYNEIKAYLAGLGLSDIPLIAAEGVVDKEDIERYLNMGFQGVQIGTRFICIEESGMDPVGKQVYVNAGEEDVVLIKSPVGLPVRVLKTPLVERVMAGNKEDFSCPYKCLITCDWRTVPFCIARALLAAREGDIDNGIFLVGQNVGRINDVISTKEFFDSLR